jgi:hypothetical protein
MGGRHGKVASVIPSGSRFSRFSRHAAPIEECLEFGLCHAPASAPAEGNLYELPIAQPAPHSLHIDLQPSCDLIDREHALVHYLFSLAHFITP